MEWTSRFLTERGALAMPKKILVAVDLSELGERVVSYGHSLAHRLGVEATFIHILPQPYLWRGYEPWVPPDIDSEVREIAEKKIHYFIRKAEKGLGLESHEHNIVIEEGDPADSVIRFAREGGYNLIVVGYRGHSTLEYLVVGSTAAKVARYAPCSVLIYRPGFEPF